MNRRGFTIVEFIIVISIMSILLILGVVNLRSSQANGRDVERKVDVETIAQQLETYYTSGTDTTITAADCTMTGGITTHDGLYTVHKFTTVGTSSLTCTNAVSAQVLVVAGGGGGVSGGGGAGGVINNMTFTVNAQAYSVTVGNGGSGGNAASAAGATNGQNSVFSTLTAVGGGYGGKNDLASSATVGGSGGGGGSTSTVQTNGGAGTTGQGNAGGTVTSSYYASPYPSAGGGGAGGVGSNPTGASTSGNGGIGISNSISGSSVYYGGGGGGSTWNNGTHGSGGNGGGGAGGYPNGVAGTTNTGGGGGGGAGGGSGVGGAGGSGVVIIRYLTPTTTSNHTISYPSTLITTSAATMTEALVDIDIRSLIAPGLDTSNENKEISAKTTFIPANNTTQTEAGVTATIDISKDNYVYQPLKYDSINGWTLCSLATDECKKFNLYYIVENATTECPKILAGINMNKNVCMITSKNQ
ncbi:MAG: type II secretion system protein [Candidatus Saccharibacteria bacterium]